MARLTDRARNDLKCVEGPLNRNQTKTVRAARFPVPAFLISLLSLTLSSRRANVEDSVKLVPQYQY